ncbi:MAG: type II toxin-antitoxin system VapC family toxin [Janthinobacterium lividum]
MIIVDTMIWADYINHGDPRLDALLAAGATMMHPYVRGELSLGNLPKRHSVLDDLDLLPPAPMADHREVANLIESARLFGTGVGYVDTHLIASTILVQDGRLWTNDKRLKAVAERLGIAAITD